MASLAGRWQRLATALLLLLSVASAQGAIEFPELSGRVVDDAKLLSAQTKAQLSAQFAAHEAAGGNQVVVVTVPDLQGYGIEEFGYQLGRHWNIGQKEANNGVLLIVAKAERKVRIEVGYGLEGDLTDAISADIIHRQILPAFKKGQFGGGITRGSNAIIEALGGGYVVKKERRGNSRQKNPLVFIFFIIFVVLQLFSGGRRRGGMGGFFMGALLGSALGGGRSSGGFGGGGGGFGGGGGSFGGGGASGGW